jgi:DNA repair exonuclease SbcCD ATPase subunit
MDMPPIHMCVFLSHEHERLKAKIIELKNHITHLEQTITERNLDHHPHSCSISCQTNIPIQHRPSPSQPTRSPSADEQAHLHRLLSAQNELLKKYENEAINHRQQQQSLPPPPSPSVLIENYERRLAQCKNEKEQIERRAASVVQRTRKIEERYENMRRKMSVCDEGFFEEVNDLKFALQQAKSLNGEYEKTIQMLSAQLGITYPVTDNYRS